MASKAAQLDKGKAVGSHDGQRLEVQLCHVIGMVQKKSKGRERNCMNEVIPHLVLPNWCAHTYEFNVLQ